MTMIAFVRFLDRNVDAVCVIVVLVGVVIGQWVAT